MSRRPSFLPLALTLLVGACQHDSSPSSADSPAALFTVNLGLTMENAFGEGPLRLIDVSELRQGEDLDGDGNLSGRLAYVIDLALGQVVATGLAPGFPHSAHSPLPVLSVGSSLAFAVSEAETGNLDRNGDGDALDRVLALYDPASGSSANLGLAASAVSATETLVAFDVPESEQEEDLDGDGDTDDSVPAVHDRRTGETWSTGLHGARVLGADGDFVALSVDEAAVGDRNGDGDALDLVFELYDVSTRSVQHVGLALTRLFTLPYVVAHRGWWGVVVTEAEQGGLDLDGDGDALDTLTFLYDPWLGTTRNLGLRIPRGRGELEPLVLNDWPVPGTSFVSLLVWLYEPELERLVNTGLRGNAEAFGEQLLVSVPEESQGEDLDGNGRLESTVPVLYDLATGRTRSLGLDGDVQTFPGGLLLFSRESVSLRDWNGDGDRDDSVLFTYDARSRRLTNTRLAPAFATPLGDRTALMMVSEAGTDLNGDGDGVDLVVEAYDLRTKHVTNLGLATFFLFASSGERAPVCVFESEQGADLNGDGDQDDRVLFLVEVAPRAP